MLARLRFYWVVTVCGGVLMALEILSSRILAPHFGNSVYVWGSIISVFLAALSLGYLLGGRLADRQPSIAALGRILALAAACLGALQLAYAPLAARLGALTGGAPTGTLVAAAVLFGPASTLLATVSPWAVRLAARDLGHLGHTAGRLFALSTLGSLGGTLAATFLLIPFLELSRVLALLTLLTAASAGIALAGQLRVERLAAALSLLLLVSALPAAFIGGRPAGELIYERVTPYQTLQVRESRGVRRLESDRVTQATVRLADRQTTMPYIRMIPAALLLKPELHRALMIGLGGGSAGRYLIARIPDLSVEYVEIDPAVADVAHRFFFFDTGPRLRLTIEDGRGYLRRSARTWDFIYGDAYIGQSVPFHLTTAQFLDEVKRHLAPGGVFGLNLAAGLADPFSQAIYRTVRDRFDTVYVFGARGARNVLIVATPEAMTLPPGDLMARAHELDHRLRFDPPLATVAAWRTEVALDMNRVQILSDELAPVDRLIRLGERMRSAGEQLRH